VNPRTGRAERVFVNIESIYPNDQDEFSFEELRAKRRGWAEQDWRRKIGAPLQTSPGNRRQAKKVQKAVEPEDIENLTSTFQQKSDLEDPPSQSTADFSDTKPSKEKRKKVREVKQETQTVKTRLESPTGRKLKRKGSAEPTMTLHSKVAMNEVYDMFNQPLRSQAKDDTQSGDETDFGDDTYSTAGESTGTGRISAATSEYGEDTVASLHADQENTSSQPDSVSPWSDFTASKHVPKISNKAKGQSKHKQNSSEDLTDFMDPGQTQTSGLDAGFDTQAIANIANQDFGELDTKMIAELAGDMTQGDDETQDQDQDQDQHEGQGQGYGEDLKTPVELEHPEHVEIHNKPRYVPLPPEDYEPTPLRPFRDPGQLANNKLPFMTPIVERTESSLAPSTIFHDHDYFSSKTPSRSGALETSRYDSPSKLTVVDLLLESPEKDSPTSAKRKLLDVALDDRIHTLSPQKKLFVAESSTEQEEKISFTIYKEVTEPNPAEEDLFKKPEIPIKVQPKLLQPIYKGPIIQDVQCNPCDPSIRNQILTSINPPLPSYEGYHDNPGETYSHYPQMKTFAAKVAKEKTAKASPRKAQNDKTLTKAVPPILRFENSTRVYALKRELGQGAFAPVYLVDSYDPSEADDPDQENKAVASCRGALEALKTECPNTTLTWEFHVLRLLRSRLGHASRTMQSIVLAHELHAFADEAYLVLDYHPQGTILDLVNLVRAENVKNGKAVEGVDECIAMWLSVELLRVMEDIHRVGILHGDLKADNCLVRFAPDVDVSGPYSPDGKDGWHTKGLTLIDLGRGIDMKNFKSEAKFVADWASCSQDCPEIRDCRPWTYQIDYHGIANVVHTLLFGKYIETVSNVGGLGQKKEWKTKDSLKRYWEKEIWAEVFSLLLNPTSTSDGEQMPVQRNLGRVRRMMENWLVAEGETRSKDLRGCLKRCERLVGARK